MANIYDMADTWNAGATTFTAIKMNVTDTASAAASLLLDLQVGGASKFKVDKAGKVTARGDPGTGLALESGALWPELTRDGATGGLILGFNSGYDAPICIGAADLAIRRDAANILAQRNGVNAQAFRLYNTFTDGSNNEKLSLTWVANNAYIGDEYLGTGTTSSVNLTASADVGVYGTNVFLGNRTGASVDSSLVSRWYLNGSGHFVAAVDNAYDLGAAAARPRYIYAGSAFVHPATTVASLPAAGTAGQGATAFVTDATATTARSTVAGGGANKVLVMSDGTNWLIVA